MQSLVFLNYFFKRYQRETFGRSTRHLEYDEVAHVCSRLKLETSSVLIDYEHISHAGPTVWRHLCLLYQDFFQTHT